MAGSPAVAEIVCGLPEWRRTSPGASAAHVAARNGPPDGAGPGHVCVNASTPWNGFSPHSLDVVVHPRVDARVLLRLLVGLALPALVAEVGEEQGDRRVRVLRPGPVVVAHGLVHREEVVGEAVRDQERRRRPGMVDVVGGVVGRHLLEQLRGERVALVRLAGVDPRLPRRQVGVRIGAGGAQKFS